MSQREFSRFQPRFLIAVLAFGILATAFPAWAALGGDASTIQADQVHMQGTRRTIAAQGFTVHEIQAANGTIVREYISASGLVFAVAWHGPFLPDMRQIFGSYFEPFAQGVKAQRETRIRRGPVLINQPGLVVQSGGHLRAFVGKAYIPDMLPAGVGAEDIQ